MLGALAAAASQKSRLGLWQQVMRAGTLAYCPSFGDYSYRGVTLVPGDGIGPELTASVVKVVEALNAPIVWERYDVQSGGEGSVPAEVIESIKRNKVCLKGTLQTPVGRESSASQSLNMLMRKELDTAVNVVHACNMPGVPSRFKDLDIVVIRENTEGEYSGLEHELVPGVVESIKVVTEEASRRTVEYAFEFARLNNRKKVTAVHKANIMKLGDGMFLKVADEVATRFPDIAYESMIVDNTCMQLASHPEQFDVMVTPNLYGNLAGNIIAGLCGGPGIAPGVNMGEDVAIFEQGARHVGADLAGKGLANPTAMLLATVMLLRHFKWGHYADKLEKAVKAVYATGNTAELTPDVGGTGNIDAFTGAVISQLK